MTGEYKKCIIIDNKLIVGSSLSLKYLSDLTSKMGIIGFEKLAGVPSCIGGSIVNNVSCFGQCITDYLSEIELLNLKGKTKILSKKDVDFSYHFSSLVNEGNLIVQCIFYITKTKINELIIERNRTNLIRQNSQPYDRLTLGSTFKKIEGVCVPQLIEKLNLKGTSINRSQVSKIHSNFIEIGNNEKIENIISLIELVNRLLYNKLGYYIDLEIELIRG